ncbi:MAG: cupin domain-containing protein [Steroidobacteraceae bacterium]
MDDSAAPGYSPSPRPTYDVPTLVRRSDIKHHVWGDKQSGLVGDWLYASTGKLHVLEFGMAPGGWFKHSPAFRTVFAADEVLYVLGGAMLACNPQTGEVVECLAGESLFFRKDTWHHVRAQGIESLRVLEFFAPPPSQGTSGAYAMKQDYLEAPVYRRNDLLGNCIGAAKPATLHRIGTRERSLRLEGEIVVGLIASTEHLTVAELKVPSGVAGEKTAHGGDAMIVGLTGELMIRTHWKSQAATFELGPRDAVFIPETGQYEILSFSGPASALLGVAPRYLP